MRKIQKEKVATYLAPNEVEALDYVREKFRLGSNAAALRYCIAHTFDTLGRTPSIPKPNLEYK